MSLNAAVILAAGSSTRMGASQKKEYSKIDGIPVLAKSVKTFETTGLFQIIIIVIPNGHEKRVTGLIGKYIDLHKVRFIHGGEKRQESVFLGLKSLIAENPDYVLIHDAARPWIKAELIKKVFKAVKKYKACIPVTDSVNALKQVNGTGKIIDHIDRSNIKAAQTPQGFSFKEIYKAHEKAAVTDICFNDDSEVYNYLYKEVYTIKGDIQNKKITYMSDLK